MASLTPTAISDILQPYMAGATTPTVSLYSQLAAYLELLLKWNARTNLTAVRSPEEIVRRHFGESLFSARHLPAGASLLDFGSGAGFPGLPIQLLYPGLEVTLAESQNKKAAFLREAVRTLGLNTRIWPARVESMPPAQQFDIVILRAVDKMDRAIAAAAPHSRQHLVLLTTTNQTLPDLPEFTYTSATSIPGTLEGQLQFARRVCSIANVPRGTSL